MTRHDSSKTRSIAVSLARVSPRAGRSPMNTSRAITLAMLAGCACTGAAAIAQCPSEGNCFTPHGALGCQLPSCCEQVCVLDSFCCETKWDAICADLAFDTCLGCPPSDHGALVKGAPGCTDVGCCGVVCMADSYCCDTAWDQTCVDEALTLCCNGCACMDNGCNPGCPPDFDFNGEIDGSDLGTLLGEWGFAGGGGCADFDASGFVGGEDLGTLLGSWGPNCPGISVGACWPSEGCRGTIIEISGSGFGNNPDDLCVLLMPQRFVAGRVIRATDSVITAEIIGVPPNAGPGVWSVAKAKGCSAILPDGSVLSGTTGAWGWSSQASDEFFDARSEFFTPIAHEAAPNFGDCEPDAAPPSFVNWSVVGGDQDALPFQSITLILPANPCPGFVGWPLGAFVTLDVHFDRICGSTMTHFDAFLPPMSVIVPAAPANAVAANLAAALAGAFAGAQGGLAITSAGNTITISVGPGCKIPPASVGGVLIINCP